eukprot:1154994-Pelagomonas_calceolata.AAC.6
MGKDSSLNAIQPVLRCAVLAFLHTRHKLFMDRRKNAAMSVGARYKLKDWSSRPSAASTVKHCQPASSGKPCPAAYC